MNFDRFDEFPMPPEEAIFWERLRGMPAIEAEQECVLRREYMVLQINMLNQQKPEPGPGRIREERLIAQELVQLQTSISVINERIKYYRKVRNAANWSNAVKALFGQDGWNQCREWVVAQEVQLVSEID